MDLLTPPSSRPPSPNREQVTPITETITEEGDLLARKAGLGNLMKTAKQDVQVPEFDMGAFE